MGTAGMKSTIGTGFAAVLLACLPELAGAEGDAASGEKVFRKCKACHTVGEGAKNRVGPVLNGIVGRAVASVEGFAYSEALEALAAEGRVWTPEELSAFLEKPRTYAKGNKMSFAGLRKEQERADVIEYLAGFAEEGGS